MGEAKRIAEAEEQRRNRKISFIKEHAPTILMGLLMGPECKNRNIEGIVLETAQLFDEIDNHCRKIAMGESK